MQRWTNQHEPEPPAASGKFLSAEEVVSMVNLLRELRDLTLSRRTFATATESRWVRRVSCCSLNPNRSARRPG